MEKQSSESSDSNLLDLKKQLQPRDLLLLPAPTFPLCVYMFCCYHCLLHYRPTECVTCGHILTTTTTTEQAIQLKVAG